MSETITQSKSEETDLQAKKNLMYLDQLLKPEVQESLTTLSRAITKIN